MTSTARTAGDPLLCVTMSPEAAAKFKAALFWASAAAAARAEKWADEGNEGRAELFHDHADWLRWGASRITNAEIDDA
jgi:hypothetical protein